MKGPESTIWLFGVDNPNDPISGAVNRAPWMGTPQGAGYVAVFGSSGEIAIGDGPMAGVIDGDAENGLDVRAGLFARAWDLTDPTSLENVASATFGEVLLDPNIAFAFKALLANSAVYGYDTEADDGTMFAVTAIATPGAVQLGGTVQGLVTASVLYAADGSGLGVRISNGSTDAIAAQNSTNAMVATPPGEWSVTHAPAANTRATITRAAGAAGVRNVCKSITASAIGLAAAAETTVTVTLRDGATGAGTVLWSQTIYIPVGGQNGIALSGLNIVGSDETAMTLEFSAAGGANTFESVALSGYDAI